MAGHRSNYGKRSHSQSSGFSDGGGDKRRNLGGDRDSFSIGPEDTVYRYLCQGKKIGSIIGRGGEIVKQLRSDTKSKIRIGESVPGCDERVVTIYSTSEETNDVEGFDGHICPAQDALFRVHDRIVADDASMEEDSEETPHVTVRILVPSDQIGCIIGKGGQVVQNIRADTGAQVRILKDDNLPVVALRTDELVQISGDASVVRKALLMISSRVHDNPSRFQHLLSSSSVPTAYSSGSSVLAAGAQIMGLTSVMAPYSGYKGESADWSRSLYAPSRGEVPSKEFSLRLICPTAYVGGVIGKGGAIINQIRQDSRATIKVESSAADEDDCVIEICAKEIFDDAVSPVIEAVLLLLPRCSEKVERDSGLFSYTTRLLVPSAHIGCLIGKGGSIISDMRRVTKASIRILSKENLPKIATEDDEMVLVSGDLDVAKDAVIQVISRLRANIFEKEGGLSAFLPVVPYLQLPTDHPESLNYDSRDSKPRGRAYSYSSGYGGSADLQPADVYRSYGSLQAGSDRSAYGVYGHYSVRSLGSGPPPRNPVSRGRNPDY